MSKSCQGLLKDLVHCLRESECFKVRLKNLQFVKESSQRIALPFALHMLMFYVDKVSFICYIHADREEGYQSLREGGRRMCNVKSSVCSL